MLAQFGHDCAPVFLNFVLVMTSAYMPSAIEGKTACLVIDIMKQCAQNLAGVVGLDFIVM